MKENYSDAKETWVHFDTLSFGYDSSSKHHSFTIAASYISSFDFKIKKSLSVVVPSFNYDYYTDSGNLFFLTLLLPSPDLYYERDELIYAAPLLGYTWAWEHFHFGLTMHSSIFFRKKSSDILLPLLPFFYWRL